MASASTFSGGEHNQGNQIWQNSGTINIGSHSQNDERVRDEKCRRELQTPNPRLEKKRIEGKKGGLLKDSYEWVLEHKDFRTWRDEKHSQLLWVHGDPGKGKTMLLCGIVDELSKDPTNTVSYFFCEANDSRLNRDIAVLRGLIFMLVKKNPFLISHVREVYDNAEEHPFEGDYAAEYLSEILISIFSDSQLKSTYLVIDALDECTDRLDRLLAFIVEHSSTQSNIKWLVSSRNWQDIEIALEDATSETKFSLELNEASVAKAVTCYIDYQVENLTKKKCYNIEMSESILQHLRSNAHGTFLWVALVCKRLEQIPRGITPMNLDAFPPGLDELYRRMLDDIDKASEHIPKLCKSILGVIATVFQPITLDELLSCIDLSGRFYNRDGPKTLVELCGSFLTIRERTIYLVHHSALDFLRTKAAQAIFLTGVSNIHQSICSNSLMAISDVLREDVCYLGHPGTSIDDIDVELVDDTPLARVKYSCISWIAHLRSFFQTSGDLTNNYLQEHGPIDLFFKNDFLHWLEALGILRKLPNATYDWSPCLQTLDTLVGNPRGFDFHYSERLIFSHDSELLASAVGPDYLVLDASSGSRLFTVPGMIATSVFSPDSKFLAFNQDEGSLEIWDRSKGCSSQPLEDTDDMLCSPCFSIDGIYFAGVIEDFARGELTIKIWDTSSGRCRRQTIQSSWGKSPADEGISFKETWYYENDSVRADIERGKYYRGGISFSPDSTLIAAIFRDGLHIWSTQSGDLLGTISGDFHWFEFSFHSKAIALVDQIANQITVYDAQSHEPVFSIKGETDKSQFVTFSHYYRLLALISGPNHISVWDWISGKCLQNIENSTLDLVNVSCTSTDMPGKSDDVHEITNCVTFSPNSMPIALTTQAGIWVLNIINGQLSHFVKMNGLTFFNARHPHDNRLRYPVIGRNTRAIWVMKESAAVAFSHDSSKLAFSSGIGIKIWDISRQYEQQTRVHDRESKTNLVQFSNDSQFILSSTTDRHDTPYYFGSGGGRGMAFWDADSDQCIATLKGSIRPYAFSHDPKWFAMAFCDDEESYINIWECNKSKSVQIPKSSLEIAPDYIRSMFFSGDSKYLITSSVDGIVKIWDSSTGHYIETLGGTPSFEDWEVLAASHDSRLVAVASRTSRPRDVRIWSFDESFLHIQTFCIDVTLHSWPVMAFSGDSRFAAYSNKNFLEVQDIKNGGRQQIRVKDDDDNYDKNTNGLSRDYISRIIFSPDSTMIATHSRPFDCIEIWDITSGQCLHHLSTPLRFGDISFDSTCSYLETDLGTICLPAVSEGRNRHKVPEFKGYSISEDYKWITWNSEKVLWLPVDYQPVTGGFAVSGSKICIGTASNGVVILNMDPTGPFGPQSLEVRASLKRRRDGNSPDEAAKRPMKSL
ncbi:hypothetical protein PENSTE_c001G08477 [Penicillium steckii]|uniref:NACHT domain-containing protein n=1 Tax=Penicillium steckii TaxID=303698 RepID=A0A1V6TYK1_9EURO|nr:hypothetical protein PENSTE_c001G08477 [Penicillium steckii]